MIPYPLSKIDAAVFQEICDQQTSESSTLDFKQTLPGKDDKDKEELAKDVSALLNADGGDLVYGIGEDRATGTAKAVVPLNIENFDKEERRILQVLDAWIEPRFHGIKLHQVQLEGGCGIVIRVPMSFEGPHCVRTTSGARRFVIRNGKMTSDMSFDQVRTAFTGASSLEVQGRNFIKARLKLIEERKTQMPMAEVPLAAFELVSLPGLARRRNIDIKKANFVDFIVWDSGGNPRMNLDGVGAFCAGPEGTAYAQSQLFRNGSMEFIQTAGGLDMNGKMGVWGEYAFGFFEKSMNSAINAAQKFDISGPALIVCALMHVGELPLETGGYPFFRHISDRPFMVFPEIYIEDLAGEVSVGEILSDTREVLYQAFGIANAPAKR